MCFRTSENILRGHFGWSTGRKRSPALGTPSGGNLFALFFSFPTAVKLISHVGLPVPIAVGSFFFFFLPFVLKHAVKFLLMKLR